MSLWCCELMWHIVVGLGLVVMHVKSAAGGQHFKRLCCCDWVLLVPYVVDPEDLFSAYVSSQWCCEPLLEYFLD